MFTKIVYNQIFLVYLGATAPHLLGGDIPEERKIDQRLPLVGGNVKLYMLAYDFSITAYTR